MRWLLLFLLVLPAWSEPSARQDLDDLIALGRSASDLLQGIVTESRELIRDTRRPDPFSYQPAVKELSFRSLTLKGRVKEPQELVAAAELAEAGTADLQRCLDQLSVLADHPEIQAERERLLATLTRTQEELTRLMTLLAKADKLINGTPASPPAPTPPQ